jgi:ATP-dependent Clp protease ATP-binding subunit ClpC
MFERYTEKARRVIFFGRYEASQFGSPYIESEHLLLGLLREDKALSNRFFRSHAAVESIRKQIEAQTPIREKVSTSIDLPLSNECKRVLAYAAEEAERLDHKHIGTEHLLLGLMREENCVAAQLLKKIGLQIDGVREELISSPQPSAPPGAAESVPLPVPFRDLTQEATDGLLDPVVDRDVELESIIEILGSRGKRNAILMGERGAGRTAIVEGLAQRIANGTVPAFLATKRLFLVKPELVAAWAKDRRKLEVLSNLIRAKVKTPDTILFMDGVRSLLSTATSSETLDVSGAFLYALSDSALQCIGSETEGNFREATRTIPWLEECFRIVHVRPLDEAGTLKVLVARKSRLEQFHGLTYEEEALKFAAYSSDKYLQGSALPGKALELLDAAGSLVKLREAGAVPDEITELQKRISFIVLRMESSIANHEFEKARFFSAEESKERENLRVLREKHKLDDSAPGIVGLKDVEEVTARWATYPYCLPKE